MLLTQPVNTKIFFRILELRILRYLDLKIFIYGGLLNTVSANHQVPTNKIWMKQCVDCHNQFIIFPLTHNSGGSRVVI